MTEYGRIHTDGSRSGGQPALKPCPFCGSIDVYPVSPSLGHSSWRVFCDDCHAEGPQIPSCNSDEGEARCQWVWQIRQPTQSDAVRDLVATLWCASGCSCCRDDDAWEKASHELAELLGIPKYDDGSGYDWYSVCDAAKGQSK